MRIAKPLLVAPPNKRKPLYLLSLLVFLVAVSACEGKPIVTDDEGAVYGRRYSCHGQ